MNLKALILITAQVLFSSLLLADEIIKEITSEPKEVYAQASEEWRDKCDEWKTEMKKQSVVKLDCGNMHCSYGVTTVCSSFGFAEVRK